MKHLIMLVMTVALLGVALAAPHAEHRSKDDQDDEEKEEKVVVPILKQINRLNDDGSYTFGFEAGDGTFRVETRSLDGHVQGKYGYVDSEGQLKVVEYVTGKESGRSVGFQPTGQNLPAVRLPEPEEQQKHLDFQYFSVDDDEDGIPDAAPDNVLVPAAVPAVAAISTLTPVTRFVPAPSPVFQFPQQVVRSSPSFPFSSIGASEDDIHSIPFHSVRIF